MSVATSKIHLRKDGEKMKRKKITKKRVKIKTTCYYNLEGKIINPNISDEKKKIVLKLIENEVESRY